MPSQSPERETVERLAEEFVERYRRGERPPLSEYTDRYPEHAAEIRDLFPALVMIEQIAPDSSESEAGDDPATKAGADELKQLGDYRILREIGRGGMGIVYEAEQVSLGRHVALKVLSQQMQRDSTQKRRFEREARAAAKLHHTNIVPVFGVGEDNGVCYYVMQFIHGLGLDDVIHELRHLLKEHGPLQSGPLVVEKPSTPRDVSAVAIARSLMTAEFQALEQSSDGNSRGAVVPGDRMAAVTHARSTAATPSCGVVRPGDSSAHFSSSAALPGQGKDSSGGRVANYWQSVAQISLQVAEALHHAHEQGVLHRDIKPSNLLLDMHGNVWVTDFGLAKVEDQQNITHTGDVLGTLRYMAPELFNGQADARSEVYSLGLTLYELLALKPAFDETDRHKLIKQVTTAEAPRLDTTAPGVPRDLATICQKSIETDPARRYQSAAALADDLRRWLNGEPIKARPIGRLEKTVRWCRRYPAVAGLLAAVVVVTVLGFAGVLWEWHEAEKQRQDAVDARKTADAERDKALWLAYKASIKAASAALASDNILLCEQALAEAPEEYRGWEWRHLASQLDHSATVLQGGPQWQESDSVYAMAVNPKGNMLVTCQRGGSIRLWALPAGKLIKEWSLPKDVSLDLVFSPDGERLVGYKAGTLLLWNVKTAEQLASLEHKKTPLQSGIHFSPDGGILAYFSHDESTIHRWDGHTGKPLPEAEAKPPSLRTDVKYVSTGNNLVIPWQKGTQAYVLDVKTGKQHELLTIPGESYSLHARAFTPDQGHLVTGGRWPDHAVSLWDVQDGKRLWKATGHSNSVDKLVVSPDGSQVASISTDNTVRLWELKTGKPIAVLRGHSKHIYNAAFSPDGAWIFTCSMDKTIRAWDTQTGAWLFTLRGHQAAVRAVAILPGGQMLLSQEWGGKVLSWNLEFLMRDLLRGHTSFAYDAIFSPDGSRLVSVGWDKTIRQWDVANGRQCAVLDSLPAAALSAAIHPDGQHVASALNENQGLVVWDMLAGKIKHRLQIPSDFFGTEARIMFHPDGSLLAAGSADGAIYLWETENYQLIKKLIGHKKMVTAVCFDRSGSQLFSGDYLGEMRAWNVATGQVIDIWKGHANNRITSLTTSSDDKLLASTCWDETVTETVIIWDASTGQRVTTLKPGTAVYDAAFHPKENRLALACADHTIRLWDTEKWQEVAQLHGHQAYVHSVDFSPDGTRLVSASGDFTVRLWDTVPAKERVKKWTPVKKLPPSAAWHGKEYVPPQHYLCCRAN